jgi:Fe-S-cluster-containing hydrogenase component 2/putative sterol carrier protein
MEKPGLETAKPSRAEYHSTKKLRIIPDFQRSRLTDRGRLIDIRAVLKMSRNAHTDWSFPFPAPGRKRRAEEAKRVPPRTAYLWPHRPADPDDALPSRGVPSPVSLADLKRHMLANVDCDDVGVISIHDPAIAHEFDEIRYVYPHAQSLICLIAEENKPAMQSRYLPTANHELYTTEERLFAAGRDTVKYLRTLGGAGLTTTVGWPQEVSVRWADKIWPLSHKLVAQAAGLGVIGLSRNFLHRRFGAYCLIDTVVTNLEFSDLDQPTEWNPCIDCNLCVASCPTDAIRSDGDFDFFACYNHTYRDSIPGFLDLVRDLGESRPARFGKRWTDTEIAALWQSLAFRVEYRCFNCVATCPAEIHTEFHARRETRREYLDETLKPLSRVRREVEEQFVIDTPSARAKFGIPPGKWRTEKNPDDPASRTVRLVDLRRIRTQDVDAMMRNMPQYFRDTEADGLSFATRFELDGPGGGTWTMTIDSNRCRVEPGISGEVDLVIRCAARTFLGIHQGEISAPLALATGRVRLHGRRRLFLTFPRLFGFSPGSSWLHRFAHFVRRSFGAGRAHGGSA